MFEEKDWNSEGGSTASVNIGEDKGRRKKGRKGKKRRNEK